MWSDYKKIEHEKYKYEVTEISYCETGIRNRPFWSKYFHMDAGGKLTVKVGYRWDGVSGPTWDSANTMWPGCVHDVLYQSLREKLITVAEWANGPDEFILIVMKGLRREIDALFEFLLEMEGMWAFRRSYYYWAVRKFGEQYTMPEELK